MCFWATVVVQDQNTNFKDARLFSQGRPKQKDRKTHTQAGNTKKRKKRNERNEREIPYQGRYGKRMLIVSLIVSRYRFWDMKVVLFCYLEGRGKTEKTEKAEKTEKTEI